MCPPHSMHKTSSSITSSNAMSEPSTLALWKCPCGNANEVASSCSACINKHMLDLLLGDISQPSPLETLPFDDTSFIAFPPPIIPSDLFAIPDAFSALLPAPIAAPEPHMPNPNVKDYGIAAIHPDFSTNTSIINTSNNFNAFAPSSFFQEHTPPPSFADLAQFPAFQGALFEDMSASDNVVFSPSRPRRARSNAVSVPLEDLPTIQSFTDMSAPLSPISPLLTTLDTTFTTLNKSTFPIPDATLSTPYPSPCLSTISINATPSLPPPPRRRRSSTTTSIDPSTSFICPYADCQKPFTRKTNLRTHLLTHDPHRPRPYVCTFPGCTRSFVRMHDVERHAGVHGGVKSVWCECGVGFKRRDAWERHLRRDKCRKEGKRSVSESM